MKHLLYFSLSLLVLLSACKKKSKCPDTNYTENQLIEEFHNASFNPELLKTDKSNFGVYLDYSGSIKVAFADTKTEAFYNLFVNSLKVSQVDFFNVDKMDVTKIPNVNKSELYKKIKDPTRFVGENAPLNKAVTQIVSQNQEAVFITDGELWENGEHNDPWAREEFGKWLKAGNTIEFYLTDHVDAGKNKHLFYMFFVPKSKLNDKEGIANVFRFYLENSAEAKQLIYKHFTFSNSNFELSQDYASAAKGGANENAELDPQTYINKGKTNGFEYQEYFTPWKKMIKFIRNAYDDKGAEIKGGSPLLNKLFFDASKSEFYTVKEIGVKVYSVRKDFDLFAKIKAAKLNPPSFELDEKGQKLLDQQNKPILKCAGQSDCYDENGKLLIDTIFKLSTLEEVKELFDFDTESFNNALKNKGKGELILKIHPNFNGSQISDKEENLHRIDIYLKSVSPNTTSTNLEKLIWEGKQVPKNSSIYNSILGALNEANPEGKVIYSFYIKTQANDFKP